MEAFTDIDWSHRLFGDCDQQKQRSEPPKEQPLHRLPDDLDRFGDLEPSEGLLFHSQIVGLTLRLKT